MYKMSVSENFLFRKMKFKQGTHHKKFCLRFVAFMGNDLKTGILAKKPIDYLLIQHSFPLETAFQDHLLIPIYFSNILAQHSTISSASKLPTSKSGQIRTANHLTISERGILSDKKSPAARGHVSLIKPPSRTPKLSASSSVTSSSKFGYPTEKK